MKKQEAIDLIKQKMAEGLSQEEIAPMLLEDGKIGSYNITDEIIKKLFEEAYSSENEQVDTPKPIIQEVPTYEEWLVRAELDKDNKRSLVKVKKIKEVRISEEQANILNRGFSATQYYKK
jgi:hypothetical protein